MDLFVYVYIFPELFIMVCCGVIVAVSFLSSVDLTRYVPGTKLKKGQIPVGAWGAYTGAAPHPAKAEPKFVVPVQEILPKKELPQQDYTWNPSQHFWDHRFKP